MRTALALSFFLLAACSAEKRTLDIPAEAEIVDAGADVMVELDASPDCELKPYYVDKDGDNFADIDPVMSCVPPLGQGWLPDPPDCNDEDPNVFPGQTKFFDVPIPGRLQFKADWFDYNCNGRNDPEYLYMRPEYKYTGRCSAQLCDKSIGILELGPYNCGEPYTLNECTGCEYSVRENACICEYSMRQIVMRCR